MQVLFTFQPQDELRQLFIQHLDDCCELLFPPDTELDTLVEMAAGAEVAVGWRVDKEILDAADRLRLWQNPGAGVTHLIELFSDYPHVCLANCHGNSYFTAQHAVALLLTLSNKIHLHHRWMREGRWRTGDEQAKSTPIGNLSIGLLGYGHIGRKIARFLSGFDVEISAYKRSRRPADEQLPEVICRYSMEDADLVEFISDADILISSLPLTDETEGLLGDEHMSALGGEGLLVNVGRAGVVKEEALFSALRDKTIAGTAIDVWWKELDPIQHSDGGLRPFNRPFHQLDNVVMSPHRAASPKDDLPRWEEVIENVRRAAQGRDDFQNLVDVQRGY